MNYKLIIKILGLFSASTGVFMLLPVMWSIYYRENDLLPLLFSMILTTSSGLFVFWMFRKEKGEVQRKEGMFIVTFTWICAAFFGALPFYFSDAPGFNSFIDCFFESMSGFTTTGASILSDIEAVPHGLLFWRSLTHWLGGMGIIVLFIAVLPFLGVGGRELYRSEAPGPSKEGLRPRIMQTARTLWVIYVALTLIEIILLKIAGMSFFDAICHTFGTLATGGFSTKNTSVAYFASPLIEGIITAFMVLAGINFSLYFIALKGNLKSLLKDTELRTYLLLIFFLSGSFTLYLFHAQIFNSISESFRYSAFQVVSILTTTGYCSVDFDLWPPVARVTLVILMFIGGCAGSTGGGMKVIRIMVIFKDGIREIKKSFQPHSVFTIKVGDRKVKDETASVIRGYFILFMLIFFLGSSAMAGFGLDPLTAITSVAATMGNIGPGLADIGPAMNYGFVPEGGKLLLTFFMLIGRLELFTVLVILFPLFWKD